MRCTYCKAYILPYSLQLHWCSLLPHIKPAVERSLGELSAGGSGHDALWTVVPSRPLTRQYCGAVLTNLEIARTEPRSSFNINCPRGLLSLSLSLTGPSYGLQFFSSHNVSLHTVTRQAWSLLTCHGPLGEAQSAGHCYSIALSRHSLPAVRVENGSV